MDNKKVFAKGLYLAPAPVQFFCQKLSICIDDFGKWIKDNSAEGGMQYLSKGKNGKVYLNLQITEKREPDQKGNTHTISVDTWKPQQQSAGCPSQPNPEEEKPLLETGKVIENSPETDDIPF